MTSDCLAISATPPDVPAVVKASIMAQAAGTTASRALTQATTWTTGGDGVRQRRSTTTRGIAKEAGRATYAGQASLAE